MSTAFLRVLQTFQDQYGSPFAHDESVAVGIEGSAGLFWLLVAS